MLERLLASTDIHAVQDRDAQGHVDAAGIVLGEASYRFVGGVGGAIERAVELEGALEVSGWAADLTNNRPAETIVATIGAQVVCQTKPIGRRPDIEAGYGDGIRPAQFTLLIRLPKGAGDTPGIRIFALGAGGRAIPVSTGPAKWFATAAPA
jgi:hypothetical protein